MKFILFNINDTKKNTINKIQLDDKHYINEVSLSKTILESMENNPKGIIETLKHKCQNVNIERKILKALEGYNKKWYYVLSKDIKETKYISNKTQELLGYPLIAKCELDKNIFKYIDEYCEKKEQLKKHEIKVLFVVSNNKNINFNIIENLIKYYKSVNVYLKEKPSSYILKRIKQINKNEGTTIDIIKKERKVFTEYDVIYFVDDIRQNYPRFRLNNEALVVDIDLSEKDKFNSSISYINKYMKRKDIFKDNIASLLKKYNNIKVGEIIKNCK